MAVSNVELRVDANNAVSQLKRTSAEAQKLDKAAVSATGNIQRMGVAFRATAGSVVAMYGAFNILNNTLKVAGSRQTQVATLANGIKKLGLEEASVQKLVEAADRLGKATLFDEEDFTQAFTLLTSFQRIGVDSYERVAKAAADVAQVTGQDVRSSMLQLAKALEDPTKQVTALARSGTVFTEQQKAQIKALQESGKLLEAQNLVLKELEKQYGNAAVAAGEAGIAGAMDTLGEVTRDLQEEIGNFLLPTVIDLAKSATDLIRAISDLPEPVKRSIAVTVTFAAKLFLVQKAMQAMIALRAGIAGMLAAVAAQTTVAGNASAAATPKVLGLAAGLRSLAAIGIVTVGVEFLWNGVKTGQQTEDLWKGIEDGSFKDALANLPYDKALDRLRAEEKNLTDLLAKRDEKAEELASYGGGGLKTVAGVMTGTIGRIRGEMQLLDAQIMKSQQILSSRTRPMPERTNGNGVSPALPSTKSSRGGGGSAAKQKDMSKDLYDLEMMRLNANRGTNRLKEIQLEGEIEVLKILEQQLGPREEAFRIAKAEQETLLRAGDLLMPIYDGAKEIQDAASKFGTEIAEAFIKVDDAKIAERLKEQADKMNRIYSSIGQTIQSGIVDSLTAAVDGTKSLADVASDTLRSLASILLQFGVQTALAGIGGGNKSSIFTKLFGGGRASGGTVSAGTSYVVGERGPELFTPGRSGSIAPNNALGGSNIVVNVDASGTNAQGNGQNAKQLGAAIGAAVQAELIKQQRPGGLLAR